MNKNEFISVLEKSLIRLPKADRDDILSDYEAHFALGIESGKTEEEVASTLGDPHELAQTYLENLPEGAKGAPAQIADETKEQTAENATTATNEPTDTGTAPSTPSYSAPTYGAPKTNPSTFTAQPTNNTVSDKPDTVSVVIVVFLCIAAFFALVSIIGAWIALPSIAFGCIVATGAIIAAGVASITHSIALGIGLIMLALAVLAFGILAILASIASVKGIIWLIKQFINLCKNILNGGSN